MKPMEEYVIDPRLHRARAFVLHKMRYPIMSLTSDQVMNWVLEFEDVLHTSEHEMRETLFEHMKLCNQPLIIKMAGDNK